MPSVGDVSTFFRLTLDNVYRFLCALIFAVAVWSVFARHGEASGRVTPVDQLQSVLDWLAVPSTWLAPVATWMAERVTVVAIVAVILLLAALLFSGAQDLNVFPLASAWHTRAGATALLALAILIQVDRSSIVIRSALAMAALVAAIYFAAVLLFRWMPIMRPDDFNSRFWNPFLTVFFALLAAALAILWPIGWLVSSDVSRRPGSSRWAPLYVRAMGES